MCKDGTELGVKMEQERVYECHNFENIKFEKKEFVDYELYESTFKNCTFEECTFINSAISECRFLNCTMISPKIKDSKMKYCELDTCNLIGIDWQEWIPDGTITEPMNSLKDSILKYNSFVDMSFHKFDFSKNSILDSAFANCRLTESNFFSCKLESTQFSGCDMRKADFREATGYEIAIGSNRLKGAKFSYPEVTRLLRELEITIY